MPPTDAQRRARDKWLSEKVETINLRVPKGKGIWPDRRCDQQSLDTKEGVLPLCNAPFSIEIE